MSIRRLPPTTRTSFGRSALAEPGVLPICVAPEKLDVAPDAQLMQELRDGRTNLLFVGGSSRPNKRHDELIEAFNHYLTLDPDGTADPGRKNSGDRCKRGTSARDHGGRSALKAP